jgi:predicted nucleic acid-binding protein
MIRGKYIRSFKNAHLSNDPSSSSIKEKPKYRYNLRLTDQLSEETSSKKSPNYNTKTLQGGNDNNDFSKKLKENNTNKNIFNISKALTQFNLVPNTDEKLKEKPIDKETNNFNDVRKKINFRERLNNSRKKRAFFNNNIPSNQDKEKNSNNNQNANLNTNINVKKEENNNNKEEFSSKNRILTNSEARNKKRRLRFDIIKENDENENSYNNINEFKNRNINSMVKDIKEENIGNEISDTVRCHMCFQKMVHPKMCPKCHHISCEKCLYNWFLKDQNKECNYCKEPVNFYEFISVPFMDTIVDFVEKVIYDKKKYSASFQNNFDNDLNNIKNEDFNLININNTNNIKDFCDIHPTEPLSYYCIDCSKGYCKTCFVFFGSEKDKHLNHKIIEYSEYLKLNLPLLKEQEEKIDNNIKLINDLITQCKSYKSLYEFQKNAINDYISYIRKKINEEIDEYITKIEDKIFDLKQSIELYEKTKNEINDFYRKINKKNKTSLNVQYYIDKIEKNSKKNLMNDEEISDILNVPDNFNIKIYHSKNEVIDSSKHLNKKIQLEDDIEIALDNKMKNSININISFPKDKRKHIFKALIYLKQKDLNIINGYSIDDIKEGKIYYSMSKKIKFEDNEKSVFEIKAIIYDFYFE